MHIFIYTKSKKMRNFYLYIHKGRHFPKSQAICVTFLFTKIPTLYVTRFFMKFLKLEFIYTKSMTLCVTWRFIYKNSDTSKKARQFALGFYIQKAWQFALRDFSWIFEIGGGWGHFYKQKTMNLALNFYMQKRCTFRYVFIFKKPDTLLHIFICKKSFTLCYVFI